MDSVTGWGHPPQSDPSEVTLARSILYEALAIAFQDPAHVSTEKLRDPEVSAALVEAAELLDPLRVPAAAEAGQAPGPTGVWPLAESARALIAAVVSSPASELSVCYQRLFGHTARGKVVVYETEYGVGSPFGQTQELADIGGFYEAFGLTIAKEHQERCDHIAAELEYMAFLCRKEEYLATVAGRETSLEIRQAERLFLTEHLSGFARTVGATLGKEADHPFYRAAATMLSLWMQSECEHWGLEHATPWVPLRSTADDGAPMACSSCELRQPVDPLPG